MWNKKIVETNNKDSAVLVAPPAMSAVFKSGATFERKSVEVQIVPVN